MRADAPSLAQYGPDALGVRTLDFVHPDQVDVLKVDPEAPADAPLPRYDRPITVEVWYPAKADQEGSTTLKAYMRDGKTVVDLHGKAVRDAEPAATDAPYPLVIVSHGYPGNRYLMSPIAENIASKGYVVVSIDHTDTTYSTLGPISSAVLNRPLDQHFVLEEIAKRAQDPGSFLHGLVDADNTAIIGYSMGGYGTLVSVGAGLTHEAVEATGTPFAVPRGLLAVLEAGSPSHETLVDPRVKTAVTFAPAGLKQGVMNAETIAGIRVPVLFVVGSVDDVVGYEGGVRDTWKDAKAVDRSLLTFIDANHNAGAPMAPPEEAFATDPDTGFNYSMHYLDPVWDNVRMNNVSAHFITAWLGKYLKHDTEMDAYLDLVPEAKAGVWAMDDAGQAKPEHNYWKGFPKRTAVGLTFETLKAGE
ncbi:alpha/beta hydrolase family protein [Consotaella aegiceratis]|uniref:alpha/beta hydrolase family protein n=1 Tax=Consotaella aegiceratis TaxID=3097961 RepID=UPI002F3E517C